MPPSDSTETQRLAALDAYDILDTGPEQGFDDLASLAAQICETSVALVSLVAADRQWFKAAIGFPAAQTPISHSVCAYAIQQRDLLVIPDLTQDPRTSQNPLVTGPPHIRFYAGAILETPDGRALGTLCVIDEEPRPQGLAPSQATALQALARQVMTQMELRRIAGAEARTRRALETSRNRYQAIFEGALDYAFIVMDRGGNIIDWNEGATRLFGWTAAEIRGQPLSTIFTEQDRAAGIPRLELDRAIARRRGTDERWHLRKDGTPIWTHGELRPLWSDDGEPDGFIKILRDRTLPRLAEERLHASEQRWRGLFENMREGFFTAELIRDENGRAVDYRFLEINPAFCEQSGLPATSVGRTIRSFTVGVEQWVINRFAFAVDTAQPQAFELRTTERLRWFEVRTTRDGDNRFSCLFFDITARKKIEEELAIKDERLQMALEASAIVGLWDWMVDTDLLYGDVNFARLYGLDIARTAAGLTMAQYQVFVVPEDLPPLRAGIAAVFERGADFLMDYRLAIPGRPLRWVECKGRLIRDAAGRPLRFSGTAIDITDRKTAEQQKHLLMEELSHRVKNTFAVVQAIAAQTLRRGEGATNADTAQTLLSRLHALSRAHDVLLQTTWHSARILDLLHSVLRLDAEHDRFDIAGPDLDIGSAAALSLSLLLHEMMTNAVKYGALSVDHGRVELRWYTDRTDFHLTWRERGGPPALQPERHGFGSRLIAMGIAGSRIVHLHYQPDGLHAEFAASLSKVLEA